MTKDETICLNDDGRERSKQIPQKSHKHNINSDDVMVLFIVPEDMHVPIQF